MRVRVSILLGAFALTGACDARMPAGDAGVDTAADPARDAGFRADSLGPCLLEPPDASGVRMIADYVRLAAEPVDDRLFYPFVALGVVLPVARAIEPVTTERRAGIRAAAACTDVACARAALAWSTDDADAAAMTTLAVLTPDERSALTAHLRDSGACREGAGDSEESFIASCLASTLVGTSNALDAYLFGEVTAAMRESILDELAAESDSLRYWEPVTRAIARSLLAAGRSEPVRYEPLAAENAAPIARVPTVSFDDFPYVVIIVPGQGPTDSVTRLHPAARARADLGYERWAARLAPFLLVTGGHVHPDRTDFSEAIEMRRYLIDTRGVRADAVFVDPYARHTTTNLRNATRVLVRAGVPVTRPWLVTTDALQAFAIRSDAFADRCRREIGYVPFHSVGMVGRDDTCLMPSLESLRIGLADPLDP